MNWGGIGRNVGAALLVSALFMLVGVGISVLEGNDSALAAMLISFVITFILGFFPFIFVRKTHAITLKEGYVTITLSWLLSFVVGMLPYVLYGDPFSLADAWFESVSGFTTTGATVLGNVEGLPDSLLFWRASTHFIGGLGVVVFLLLVIPDSNPVKLRLTNMELSSLSKHGYSRSSNSTVYIFAAVYLVLFVVALLSYLIAGMSPIDAVCHAMSVCATGGFSSRNASIASFDSRAIEGLTMLFMYLSSLHFGLVYMTFATHSLKHLNNQVTKFYTGAVLMVSLILGVGFKLSGVCETWGRSIWDALFSTLCISTTTGFAVLDNALWPAALSTLTIVLGIMCACAGSTSGGVKADRILLLFKSVAHQINKILHPTAVNEIRLGKRVLRQSEVTPHLLFLGLYGVCLAVSVILALMLGVDSSNSFAASVTSLSNVGPAVGELGTMGNFGGISAGAKMLFSFDMFLGRLEIYPILAVVAMVFDRRTAR